MARRRLQMSDPREIRKTLTRIANLVYSGEMDQKSANTITYICNVALSSFKNCSIVEEGDKKVKSDKQSTIQHLLRAAEITGNSERREQYLDTADVLLRKELSVEVLEAAEKVGLFK